MRNIASRIQSVEDARYFAQRRLPKGLYRLLEAGSGAGLTMSANVAAFEEVLFRPRAGVWHSKRELGTTVLGQQISMPVLAGPARKASSPGCAIPSPPTCSPRSAHASCS
jgi:isopentenyl diphosphate isomerase/L-lactate dehydrogenase-like FMN-dependent dehydrogenase